jgi:trans-2,3-dihydro-3-hydroxyanthranilate isomerase
VPAPELLDFEVVDVFAPHPFSGNQLAVVLDAGELTTAQCQALAAEFGYSESTFVSAPSAPGADYRVRIFTPRTELAAEGLVGEGVTDYRLAQGAAVGRPSELAGRVTVSGGAVTAVNVAGAVRPIASGTVCVPAGS